MWDRPCLNRDRHFIFSRLNLENSPITTAFCVIWRMRSVLPHRAVGGAGVPLKVDVFGQPHLPFKETDVELISTLVFKSPKTFRSFPKIILTHFWIMTARTTLITWLSQVFFTAGHCARLSFWISTCYIMNTRGSQCSVLCPHSWHDKPSFSQLQSKVFSYILWWMLDLSGAVNITCVWVVFLITSHRRAQAISCSSLVFLSFDELCDLFHDVGLAILLRSCSVVWLTYWKN